MKQKLFFLLFMAFIPIAMMAYDVEKDGIYYYLDSNAKTAEVRSRNPRYSGDVVIPESFVYKDYYDVNNDITYSVTSIGGYAFSDCPGLTSITIPNSVTSIGDYAFRGCSGLTSITIPNSVTSIGDNAFYECSGLTSITIPNSVTSIGYGAFSFCSGLTSITIPNSVTSIGGYAFRGCSGLTSITIPNSVTSIGDYAFSGCSGLTSVTIPNSVTSIGEDAFLGCTSLMAMKVENGNKIYDSRNNCNAIIETSSNTLKFGCKNTVIPDGVTSIGFKAFYGCSSLTSITIPNSVTSIEMYAFYDCSGLTSITIPNSVTSIEEYAFWGCSSLPIENSIRYADTYLLEAVDKNLTTYQIKEGTRLIGYSAFSDCSSLTSITIPNSVTSIGEGAFSGCDNLTTIELGSGIQSIGGGAFYCRNMDKVICRSKAVPSVGHRAFGEYGPYQSTLYVPKSALDDYKTANTWKAFKFILPIEPKTVVTIGSQTREYGDANPTFTYTVSGDPLSGSPTPTTMATVTSAPGEYAITMANPGDPDEIEISDGILTITKAPLAITPVSYTITEGDALPTFTANFSGFKNGENVSNLTTYAITCAANNSNTPGAYDIIVNAASPNYDITCGMGTLTIIPASGSTDITISSYGVGTFCSEFDLDFTNITGPDFKACIIAGYLPATNSVLAVPVKEAPAGTGLYLIGKPGTYTASCKESSSYYSNMLVGVTKDSSVGPTDGDFTNFFLSLNNSKLEFRSATGNMNVPAHRAYLQIPTSLISNSGGTAYAVNVVFEEEATGIHEVEENSNDGEWYTLSGVRVEHPSKGIYIHNGRKVVIK